MDEQFIPFKQALELKELGFNEPCMAYYNSIEPLFFEDMYRNNTNKDSRNIIYDNDCTAPLWQQTFDWFRIKHKLLSYIDTLEYDKWCFHYGNNLPSKQSLKVVEPGKFDVEDYDTYEEARQACLEKLIEIVLNLCNK